LAQASSSDSTTQFGGPDDPSVGPTADPAVPVFEVVPVVGSAPNAVSGGITTPRRDERGGNGSACPEADGDAGGGGGVVAQDPIIPRTRAASNNDRGAIGETT
jgi:hypothetical protein